MRNIQNADLPRPFYFRNSYMDTILDCITRHFSNNIVKHFILIDELRSGEEWHDDDDDDDDDNDE
ncbi:unnamed protein product [Brassica rapa]|uniref:Uncharacterized protein n=1 Tax=Brassica campestris TaxID=3711 RepID=A0A8D9H341_BRACM|nr:unnamed protein product [Brassica rapa]